VVSEFRCESQAVGVAQPRLCSDCRGERGVQVGTLTGQQHVLVDDLTGQGVPEDVTAFDGVGREHVVGHAFA
jgi:hypothetical protein